MPGGPMITSEAIEPEPAVEPVGGPIGRSGRGRVGITGAGLAVLLAAATLPITAWGLTLVSGDAAGDWAGPARVIGRAPDLGLAFELALGACLAGAAIGGMAGGLAASRGRRGVFLVALFVAWPAAIIALPIVPGLAGHPIEFEAPPFSGLQPDFVGWTEGPQTGEPVFRAVQTYVASLYAGSEVIMGLGWWLMPIAMAITIVRRRRRLPLIEPGLTAGITLWTGLNAASILRAPIPALVLVVGVAAWAIGLDRFTGAFPSRVDDGAREADDDGAEARPGHARRAARAG